MEFLEQERKGANQSPAKTNGNASSGKTSHAVWKSKLYNMHIQLGIWEKENLGSTGLGFADLFDPLIKYMTKVNNIVNKNAASKTELKTVTALNSFVDKTISKLTVMDESTSERLKTLKFQSASVMEYGSPPGQHRNRHELTRSFDSREENSMGSLPRVVEYDSPNKRKREVYATQLERGFGAGANNYTDSKNSPQIRINQRRNYETLRDSDLPSKVVKPGPRPLKDGIRMNQLSFKIDQAKRQIDRIQKTISQPKSERQISSNDAKSRRLSNDSRATRIKTGAKAADMNSKEFSMQIDSSDDDTIMNTLGAGTKTKELTSKTLVPQHHTAKKVEEKHYHPNGEVCNCREKMFDVKKQLREKNWQRRKTIIQQGSFLAPKNQQALPDLKEQKSSQVLKEKFKNFERRLKILADTASIDKISPGLVKEHHARILKNKNLKA